MCSFFSSVKFDQFGEQCLDVGKRVLTLMLLWQDEELSDALMLVFYPLCHESIDESTAVVNNTARYSAAAA